MMFREVLPDTMFYMRERDPLLYKDPNPFKWVYKTTKDLFAGKKVIIFGLPGAFTPTCSNSQLPGFEELAEDFYAEGIDEIWCTSVNDAFVMYQWGLAQGVKNVRLLPDGNGDFANSLGMLVDKSNLGFGKRSWRYAMYVDNLEIKSFMAEDGCMENCPDDPYGNSAPENVLKVIREGKNAS